MPPSHALADAYASFASPNGVRLYASPSALRRLAEVVREGSSTDIALSAPPQPDLEAGPVLAVRVLGREDGPVTFRAAGQDLEIVGGIAARDLLARTLEGLADSPPTNTSVTRHVDLEYFPGHRTLSAESMWMTVFQNADASTEHDAKTRFLIVDDYGMGGIWGCVWAGSAEEVAERFANSSISGPEPPLRHAGGRPAGDGIVVFRERPNWMTPDHEADIAAERTFDLDRIEPSNYFAKFLRPRD